MNFLERLSFRAFLLASSAMTGISKALANSSAGGGAGAIDVPEIPGLPAGGGSKEDVKNIIGNIIVFVLDFLGVIAILFIIVAGIRLIVSQGEEDQKEKAKKTILYVIIGLLVIIFARIIVAFIVGGVPGLFGTT